MRARNRPKLHKPAAKPVTTHKALTTPTTQQVIDIDVGDEDVQLNFGENVLRDEWHDRDGDIVVTSSSSSEDEAEVTFAEPAAAETAIEQPASVTASSELSDEESAANSDAGEEVGIAAITRASPIAAGDARSASEDSAHESQAGSEEEQSDDGEVNAADSDEDALLAQHDDNDDEDEWPDESKNGELPVAKSTLASTNGTSTHHSDSSSDSSSSSSSSEDSSSDSSSSSDESEDDAEESKQPATEVARTAVDSTHSADMSSESEDDSANKLLHTGKRQASTLAQPAKTNKRRNTVDESSLSALQTSFLTQQQLADAKKHASNQKLRPADRLKGADQRSMGGDTASQLKATSAAAQWFKPASSDSTQPRKGRDYTVSVALPGSIIANCQTPELKTYVAGQIARSLAIYNVDEVIVYNEDTKHSNYGNDDQPPTLDGELTTSRQRSADPNVFLARILQYLECPQYLRKALFPVHPDLNYAGLLNPLDAPHHLRIDEKSMYREGLTQERSSRGKLAPKGFTHVNIGFRQTYLVKGDIKPNVRVTVKLDDDSVSHSKHELTGTVVSPHEPRKQHGLYYGYNTRLATNLTNVFRQCPYKDSPYDCTIGTSERGIDISDPQHSFGIPSTAKHILIVFGGVLGLEEYVANDESLVNINDPRQLFDWYVNICPQQGSRTIRTEEAIPITMAILQQHLRR